MLYEKVIMRNESLLQGQKINIQKHIICVYFFDENFKTCLLKNLFKKIGELRANKIFFFKLRIITKLICIFCFKKIWCFEKIFVCVFKTCCCNLNYCISLKQHTSAFREILFCLNYNIKYLDYCFFKLSWYTCFFLLG